MAYTPRDPGKQAPRNDPAPKPINAFPLIALLIAVVFLILWIGGYLV